RARVRGEVDGAPQGAPRRDPDDVQPPGPVEVADVARAPGCGEGGEVARDWGEGDVLRGEVRVDEVVVGPVDRAAGHEEVGLVVDEQVAAGVLAHQVDAAVGGLEEGRVADDRRGVGGRREGGEAGDL